MSKKSSDLSPATLDAINSAVQHAIDQRLPRYIPLSGGEYSAFGLHTIDVGCDARRGVILIPSMNGTVTEMDLSDAEFGIVRVRFEKFSRLAGVWVMPSPQDDGAST